jgi:hypothetical protein
MFSKYTLYSIPLRTKKVLDSSSETWTFATTFSVTLCIADPPPLSPLPHVNEDGKGF